MERSKMLNSFLNKSEDVVKDCRIAGGEIYLTNERIVTNKISLLKKISLSSKTSFSSIPLADVVSFKVARGIPFFSLPRLIVFYREGKRKMEVFFEFANKDDLKDFYQEFCKVFDKKLSADAYTAAGYGVIIN
ncbi:MAG: hypothetical protein A2Z50_04105 [Nitrospirae bacterium RBG_19FT_COMBO_42_15]|nr:MAG: hypothetical protein A2Z50_04105 [Nitrospirae bacterium RBG_19FT_COMBO_42_15]